MRTFKAQMANEMTTALSLAPTSDLDLGFQVGSPVVCTTGVSVTLRREDGVEFLVIVEQIKGERL